MTIHVIMIYVIEYYKINSIISSRLKIFNRKTGGIVIGKSNVGQLFYHGVIKNLVKNILSIHL